MNYHLEAFIFSFYSKSWNKLAILQPAPHQLSPLLIVSKGRTAPPAMPAFGKDIHGRRNTQLLHAQVHLHAVGRRHALIVIAQQEECGRGRGRNLQLVGITGDKGGIVLLVAQEIVARTGVRELSHRHYGIEKEHEIGTACRVTVGTQRRGHMTAGRETGNSHFGRVYLPLIGMLAHHAHGFLGIGQGYGMMPVGQAIFENDARNTFVDEHLGKHRSLVLHGLTGISAAAVFVANISKGTSPPNMA